MNSKPMTYKGYTAAIEYDDESNIFYGRVIDINDVIDFHGNSVSELKQSFADSVDAYIEFCKEINETPEKPYSGKVLVRMSQDLHRRIAVQSKLSDKSMNDWIIDAIQVRITAPEKHNRLFFSMQTQTKFCVTTSTLHTMSQQDETDDISNFASQSGWKQPRKDCH